MNNIIIKIINRFKTAPMTRARHHQRSQLDYNIHQFHKLLNVINGPANTNDYNVQVVDQQPVEPTYSVVELPKFVPDQQTSGEANVHDIPGPIVSDGALSHDELEAKLKTV